MPPRNRARRAPGVPADTLRERFWETVPLARMSPREWEALCDGCGKCCLNKLEYEDTGEVVYTRIACRLLDGDTCQCRDYPNRKLHVPECVVLTPKTLPKIAYWMPATCAYKLLWKKKKLPEWHPLLTGDDKAMKAAGACVAGRCISEDMAGPLEHHLVDWGDRKPISKRKRRP